MLVKQGLTIKKGILAVVIMYVCQLIAGLFVSIVINANNDLPIELLGLMSAFGGGCLVLLIAFYVHIKGNDSIKISEKRAAFSINRTLLYIVLLLVFTHIFAFFYRSIVLPSFGFEGVQGGGTLLFSYVHHEMGVYGMVAFLTLALLIGPIMEELVFRGYLQQSLTTRFHPLLAISLTSLVFMIGHSPIVLWPMYFVFSFAWGWIYLKSGRLSMAITFHVLNNLFYTVIGFSGLTLLA